MSIFFFLSTVAKGYNQEKGIDFDETYALVARLEALRLLLCLHVYFQIVSNGC